MEVMLAKEYTKGMEGVKKDLSDYSTPPLGWYMSEKYDGYRATFGYNGDGVPKFLSRAGKEFNAPNWFLETMPSVKLLKNLRLDGELWAGRGNFQMMGAVRKKKPVSEEWSHIKYVVYDITNSESNFVDRQKDLIRITKIAAVKWNSNKINLEHPFSTECPISYTDQLEITSVGRMESYYRKIIDDGGEGIMMKHPECIYESGRSSNMLKYKPSFDREAMIVGYKPGKGKYTGKLGGFVCKPLINCDTYMIVDEDPHHEFTLSGMDDTIRGNYKNTHEEGTIITYECSGFTDKGKPRHGRYLRKRTDVILKEAILDSSEKKDLIISIFETIEENLKINKDSFRAKAYTKVLPYLKKIPKDSDLIEENFKNIPGLGNGLSEKIRLIIETGTCPDYDKIMKNKDKFILKRLFQGIHGVGPTCADKLIDNGFKSIKDLESCESINEYLNAVQLKGLKWYEDTIMRIPYDEIVNHEIYLKGVLHKLDENAEITIAGSYRRKCIDSGDIDVLLKASDPSVYENFIRELLKSGYLQETLSHGKKKFMGVSNLDTVMFHCTNRRIDIMYTKPKEYPFAILYFTGSMEFNVKMRNQLLERGYTLNEYGVKFVETGKKFNDTFSTEKEIFDYFGYDYIEPDNR